MGISEDLINMSAKLLLAQDKKEFLSLSTELNGLAERASSLQEPEREKERCLTQFLKFTKKEVSKMPKTFKKEFVSNGACAHIIRRPSGSHGTLYEIRYRRNGYNIAASSTDLNTAKEKFIKQLSTAIVKPPVDKNKNTYCSISNEWLDNRKGKIAQQSWRAYERYNDKYITPAIGTKLITDIRTAELEKIMSTVESERLYEDVRSVLNQVFKYAMSNGIITYNPVTIVPFVRADREHGVALSPNAEAELLTQIQLPEYALIRPAILAMLFFGLRPCEIEDAKFEKGFLVARNRKRKKGKIEYKKIPISPVASRYIDINAPICPSVCQTTIRKYFNKILKDNDLYDLRHTFSTRCQEFVRREIVEIWLGDSDTRLIGNTYTHFSDEFMFSEMKKVDYIIGFTPQFTPQK